MLLKAIRIYTNLSLNMDLNNPVKLHHKIGLTKLLHILRVWLVHLQSKELIALLFISPPVLHLNMHLEQTKDIIKLQMHATTAREKVIIKTNRGKTEITVRINKTQVLELSHLRVKECCKFRNNKDLRVEKFNSNLVRQVDLRETIHESLFRMLMPLTLAQLEVKWHSLNSKTLLETIWIKLKSVLCLLNLKHQLPLLAW